MWKVECTKCWFNWIEWEDTIQLYEDMNKKVSNKKPVWDYDIINACPNCRTDGFLKDI